MGTRKERKGSSVDETRVVFTTCNHDCGGKCLLKVHVKNNVIIRIETDDGDEPQLRACARGYAQRHRVYDPDRLKYPMRRIGERGEGKFERISWDEALDGIALKMKKIKALNGTGAFVNLAYAGDGEFQGVAVGRLLNMFGGSLQHWGGASQEAHTWAIMATLGTEALPHLGIFVPHADLQNSQLIIMWAWNPATNLYDSLNNLYITQAKERGTRVVCVDPRFTDSAAVYADQWIPIIPGTDTAMLVAMAYVIIKENLQDQKFLDTYTVGFERFKEYVLGIEDGVEKTPQWAEPITGVPAATIEALAREYATTKPATLIDGWGAGRTAFGEQYHRAALTLAAMTGNLAAARYKEGAKGVHPPIPWIVLVSNPYNRWGNFVKGKNPFDVEPGIPKPQTHSLDPLPKNRRRVLQGKLYDAMLKGSAGGYPSDIKMAWINCGNTLNQFPNTNKGVRAFKNLEFIVVSEQFMTPTARFADILLPVVTSFERDSIVCPWNREAPYLFYANKVIEPMFEAKTDFQICVELAPRLGIENYSDKTEEEWLLQDMTSPGMKEYIPDHRQFKAQGVYRVSPPESTERTFPLQGKSIKIYSQELADFDNPKIPPVPKYMEGWEGRTDPLARKYPLQLLTSHHKLRAHSNFDNIALLSELEPQQVWINTVDAEERGIRDGEEVRVFNDRGEMIIPAMVTERIMPGVINICEGAWYRPDENGIDRGGCPNILTKDEHSPAGAWCTHTSLVQVVKLDKPPNPQL